MIRNLPPLVRTLIIAILASFVLSLIAGRTLGVGLPLWGPLVIHGGQLWRLVTYPFLAPGIYTALGSAIVLYFFGVELETIVHTRRLAIWLGITVLVTGVIATVLPSQPVVAGPKILYLFIVTGFTYLWPKREISIFGMFSVKTWILSTIVLVLAIIPLESMRMDYSWSNLLSPLCAVGFALVFFHVTYRQYHFARPLLERLDPLLGKRTGKGTSLGKREGTWEDKISIEHRIDALLDKISKQGIDSLSQKEREFLFKHSGK